MKPGTMLYEIAGVTEDTARRTLVRIAMKMPVRTRFVGRRMTV
ncbi:MAG: ribosomal protein L16 [Planctomycetota bacterium]